MKIPAIPLVTLLALLALPAYADDDPAILAVTGQAVLEVEPDQLNIDLGVSSHGETANAALAANSGKMNEVIAALKGLGLGDADLQTRQFQVQPIWSQRPRQPEPDWQPGIVGYRVTNSVLVSTEKMEMAGDIIGKATSAGANQVNSVTFALADPRKHRDAAIKQATEYALEDATTLAKAAGHSLGPVVSLALDNSSVSPVVLRQENLMRSAMADAAPPIQAGQVPVRASVSIRYQIR